ncbi:MAG TPA: DUF6065 family protein [Herpetosiphonaceae bacterium]
MLPYHHNILSDGAGGSLVCFPFVTQAGLDTLANQFTVRDRDVFIVSYPKSGTNWIRQIVHLLTHDGFQGSQQLHEAIPLLEREASQGQLAARSEITERRCFISHLPYQLMPGVENTQARYIFVARNPKDCAVSYFHFMASRGDIQYQGSWDEFFELFIYGQVPYGLWFDHVLAWWRASQQTSQILFLTYEDLQKDLAAAVGRIARLLEISLTPALRDRVVTQSSFAAMVANPQVNGASPQERFSNRLLRKGAVGDWRNYFSPAQDARLDALYREKIAGAGLRLAFDLEYVCSITAYPLSDHAVTLQPAPDTRPCLSQAALSTDRAFHAANQQGWELLCPYAVEITWNGGSAPEDIDIRIAAPTDAPAFVQSRLGSGLLTFYPDYQLKTGGEQRLWVRGPINRPRDGIAALEQLIDASIVPYTVAVHWQCTRPDHTIRFEQGEPFATILPAPSSGLEHATLDVAELDDDGDLDLYEQAFQQLAGSAAVQSVFQRLGAKPASEPPLLGIVFSRDRAMQLDATLRSFYLHCEDADEITLYVIYKATDRRHAAQYAQLAQMYAAESKVRFVEETDFRQDVLRLLATGGPHGLAEHLLFLVDDNVFVRGFRLAEIRQALAEHPEAIGFSLRLGANITYRYTMDEAQAVPMLTAARGPIRSFDWTTAQGYFQYPLEVSSSVFRLDELTRLLEELPFTNPNTLEGYMAEHSARFSATSPALLCYEQSITFCNPINKVQTIYANRTGDAPQYAADHLANLFDQGYRVRVAAYAGFVPSACHQEVDLLYERHQNAPLAETMQLSPSHDRHDYTTEHPLRIGYLILAHDRPNHFARLVHALDDQHARIYAHIDQKSDILPFQAHVPADRVRFIRNRIPVYWSEYSTAEAILNLIAEALDHDPRLEYLCLLSGADYLLQSASYIQHFLTRRRGTEFINLLPMPNPTMGKPIERLTEYLFRQDQAEKLAKRLKVSQLPVFSRDYRTYLGELQPYGGSTWWTLSRAACEYLLRFVAENPRVVKFFKHTLFPEEGLFQTIIGNSPFRMQVAHNLTYNDWTRPAPPYPAIIDEQHLRQVFAAPVVVADDAFGTGDLLFARKFPDDSQRLVAQLQARLAQASEQHHMA